MKRIQRSRAAGFVHPPGTLHCSRPMPLANPYNLRAFDSREDCLARFKMWMMLALRGDASTPKRMEDFRLAFVKLLADPPEFLSCFCPLTVGCHVDLIIEHANICLNRSTP